MEAVIPSWDAILRIAPLSLTILGIAYLGYLSRNGELKALRDWIEDLRKK